MGSNRNYTLDLLKLIASYMVVFIHVPFEGAFGRVISGIACFAVPLFFMTSGYFCYSNNSKTIWRKVKKIAVILFWASLLYNSMNIAITGVTESLSVYGDISRWKDFFLFNLPFSATRLWFLLALIYVYILQLILEKLKVRYTAILIVSIICLSVNLLLGEAFSLFGIDLPAHYIRNFLLTGYPFFGFGLYIRYKESYVSRMHIHIIVAMIALGVALTLITLASSADSTLYLGSVLITLSAFIWALKGANIQYDKWMIKLFNCSLGIYIFHRPVGTICSMAVSMLGNESTLVKNIMPVVVCIVSTIVALVFNAMLAKISVKNT